MDYTLTHSLLLKHLDTKAKPEEIARCLSLCGPTVDHLHQLDDGDYLYEIEVITNRVDAASARGIAREAAAILPEFDIPATLKPLHQKEISAAIASQSTDIGIAITNDPVLNRRILAIKIADVTIADSPEWLQKTLTNLGSRPLNNIIDITNYVMWELGHPIHAFDYDRLTEKKIIVREAKKGEKFVTLDDQPHTCQGGEIVFDDGSGTIIDLPGIMGTANTAITSTTKNVLLWIESVDPKRIRKASLSHQLRTQAAILNEKSVDQHLGVEAIKQAAELAVKLAKGHIASTLTDIYPHPTTPKVIHLDLEWLNRFAGITINPSKVESILGRLGITATKDGSILSCTIPTSRIVDINIKEDLAEEIMRVYGYFRLPSIIPETNLPAIATDNALLVEQAIKHQLVKQGAAEVFNLSLIDDAMLSEIKGDKAAVFSLANPLSSECVHMRPSLIPSLKKNLEHNRGTYDRPYCIFELANTYQKDPHGKLAIETPTLGMAWSRMSYRQVKGQIKALFDTIHLEPDYDQIQSINEQTYVYESKLNGVLKKASLIHRFATIPEFNPIIEDLTFTIPTDQKIGQVIETINRIDKLITKVDLKDIYKQNVTFTISYNDTKKQLATTDIAATRKQIVTTLETTHHAKLVGNLA